MVQLALLMVLVGRFDSDPAANDVIVKALQPLQSLPNGLLQCWRRVHVLEVNLQCVIHVVTSVTQVFTAVERPAIRETAYSKAPPTSAGQR